MKQSAGTLLYRRGPEGLEVLLVHASGNYNRKAPWSIPKGEPDENEDLDSAARRETLEETGIGAGADALVPLGHIVYQKSRKQVHAFAGPLPVGADPKPTSWEIDQARFMDLDVARQKIHPDQAAFLDRLLALLEDAKRQPGG